MACSAVLVTQLAVPTITHSSAETAPAYFTSFRDRLEGRTPRLTSFTGLNRGSLSDLSPVIWFCGRGGETRTRDLYVPNVAPYRLGHTPTIVAIMPRSVSRT